MKKFLSFSLFTTAMIFASIFAGCNNQQNKQNKEQEQEQEQEQEHGQELDQQASQLIVATNAEYSPYSYVENNQIVGFDIDVIKAIANKLNLELVLKDMPFDVLISELSHGKVDVIAAGLTPTEERKQQVEFAIPHFTGDPLVIVSLKTMPLNSISDLEDKTVAVNEGYTADLFLSKQPKIDLLRLPTAADGFLAMQSNRSQAFVVAKSVFIAFSKQAQTADLFQMVEIPDVQESYAFAVAKDNIELRDKISTAIEQLQQDGTIERIKSNWSL